MSCNSYFCMVVDVGSAYMGEVFAEKMMGDPSDNLTFMTNRDN